MSYNFGFSQRVNLPLTRSIALHEKAGTASNLADVNSIVDRLDPFFGLQIQPYHTNGGDLKTSVGVGLKSGVVAEDPKEVDDLMDVWSEPVCGLAPRLYLFMKGYWIHGAGGKKTAYPMFTSEGEPFRPAFYWIDTDQEQDSTGRDRHRTWFSLGEFDVLMRRSAGAVFENGHRNKERTQAIHPGRAIGTFLHLGTESKTTDLAICQIPRVTWDAQLSCFFVHSDDEKRAFSAIITGERLHDMMDLVRVSEEALRTQPLCGVGESYFTLTRVKLSGDHEVVKQFRREQEMPKLAATNDETSSSDESSDEEDGELVEAPSSAEDIGNIILAGDSAEKRKAKKAPPKRKPKAKKPRVEATATTSDESSDEAPASNGKAVITTSLGHELASALAAQQAPAEAE